MLSMRKLRTPSPRGVANVAQVTPRRWLFSTLSQTGVDSMNKHTGGNWKSTCKPGWTRAQIYNESTRIACIGPIGDEPDYMPAGEVMANSSLMAAAPELLKELKQAEAVIRHAVQESQGRVKAELVGGWLHHANQIRQVIAKATAESTEATAKPIIIPKARA